MLKSTKNKPGAKKFSRGRREAGAFRAPWWVRFRKRSSGTPPPDLPGHEELTLRAELFGVSQLENHARFLASKHEFEAVRGNERLLSQLSKSEAGIRRCHQVIAESVQQGYRIAPAAEWLLDNYHLIQEQIELAQAHLSPGYSRELPRLTAGPRRGFPRIFDIVMEVVRHTDGLVDHENLSRFIRAYQETHPLTLGELWAVPIMLRLCLIENLHLVAQRIAWRRSQRDAALLWADRFLKVVESNPRMFVTTLGDFVRAAPPLTPPFIAELVANIDGVNPSLGLALNWLEQELSDHGQTIERIQLSENQAQAANLVTTSNCITSVRTMAAIDWPDFVEAASAIEAILRRDPAGVYPQMDFRTRNRYRTQVEKLARYSRRPELEVAEAAVTLAAEYRQRNADRRESHVGYFLVDAGRFELETRIGCRFPLRRRCSRWLGRHALAFYLAAAAILTVAMAAVSGITLSGTGPGWAVALWIALALLVTSRPALELVNWVATLLVPSRFLPGLDFSKGIPPEHRTIVVVPTLLGSPTASAHLLEDLEIRYLANKTPHLLFALLTDFPDADEEELPTDREHLKAAVQGIRRLNARHAREGEPVFLLLHRPRRWNPVQRKWMGRERKRGKLEDFNRLVVEGRPEAFSVIEGDLELLRSVRYAISLDTDTQLPPGSACRLVGAIAHLLNRPQLDPVRRLVTRGYAVLQPRMAVSLASARQSIFARLRAGDVGIDPYTREVASVYPDFFGQAQYVGKGIYDIHTFHAATGNRFPDNLILSHDLIEGVHARCGFICDVELIESEPSRVLADASRRHRWIRGDWQIADWLLPRVPGPDGRPQRNPLGMLARWMIFDNLRRSLVPAALFLALVSGGWAWPAHATGRIAGLLGMYMLPAGLRTLRAFLFKGKQVPPAIHLRAAAVNEGRQWILDLLELAFTPYLAWVYLDAMVRVFWRRRVHRRLLEWKTASQSERTARTSLPGTLREMWPAPILAAACAAPALAGIAPGNPLLLGLAGAWLAAPVLAWWVSSARPARDLPLTAAQTEFVRQLARRTWAFFDHFTCEASHWLPPDNFQESPGPAAAPRTSPTNIGMALASGLAACDFGYLSPGRFLARTVGTLDTLDRMERYRGHFYNWYDIHTLQPLHPLYISSVDSGNLTAMLIVVREGLREMMRGSILPERWQAGLDDTRRILLQEIEAARRRPECPVPPAVLQEAASRIRAQLETVRDPAPAWRDILRELDACRAHMAPLAEALAPEETLAFWCAALQQQGADLAGEIRYFAPWADAELPPLPDPAAAGDMPAWEELPRETETGLTLDILATLLHRWEPRLAQLPASDFSRRWSEWLTTASARAAQRIAELRAAAVRCRELSEHDLDFLYDANRHLLSIGYNLDAHRRDPSFYDLLASECRLGSYVGVARGQLPLEHWFHLGRRLAPGGGPPVLASWSGSMFEYLMPMLVMPNYAGTLLDMACQGAVRRQIRYGRQTGVAWGISESGYNQLDSSHVYQYRAFGVPMLGMKRGLADDLVVAPYAGAMALMVIPKEAVRNLQRLAAAGAVGRFGLYEAVDHTPARVPADEPFAIVRSWMAHHSGMCMLAYDHLLHGQPMQRRFMSDLQLKSAALLLQERIPLARPRSRPTAVVAETAGSRTVETFESIARSFDTPDTPVPEVHLLSNGRYHVMVTNGGGGVSRWQGLDLTRWREDSAQDAHGFFFYLQEVDTGRTWSPTARPLASDFDRYEAVFSQGGAEFRAVAHQFQTHLQVAVCPEDDMELRQLTVTNLSRRARTIEITSYAEPVLLPGRAEAAHPAFHKLFVTAKPVPGKAALLFSRRPRTAEEHPPWMFHALGVEGGLVLRGPSYETDRAAFIGRNRSMRNPAALDLPGPLPDRAGFALDPAAAIRYRVRIEPGRSIRVNAFLGIAATQEAAETYIDRCRDPHMAERVFSLAWTRSQVLLHQLRVREADVQNYARLAGSLFFAGPHRRGRASIIAANRKNQAALWSYGISGDRPIVLLSITDAANLDLVRNLVQAHTYWRQKGLEVDLVIWSEAFAGYRQDLLDAIIGLVQAGTEGKLLDQPGGIFARNIDQVPEEDRILFRAVARLVFSDRYGALEEQIDRRVVSEPDIPELTPEREPGKPEAPVPLPRRELEFYNGLGGFTRDGREYIIQLEPGQRTPAPWVNILANPTFGTVISESGSASTWSENAHQFRLTPWHNDALEDPSGEAFYIRDEETGRCWSPMPGPARASTPCICRHGHGYSVFERADAGLFSETTVYVAIGAPLKFTAITLRNTTNRPRRVSLTGYCEWVLGENRDQNAMHVVTRLDPQSGAIFAQNAFSLDFADRLAFFHCSGEDRTLTADRTEFIGRNGSLDAPAALRREHLSNRVGAGLDPCAAIQARFEIPPGEQIQVVFSLGAARTEDEARGWLRHQGGVSGARRALEEVWTFWQHQLGGIYVETPDSSVNFLVNHWLLYQILSSRFWGRTGFYQSGGAYGFRDQLQDSLAFLRECPWLTREHLLLSASRQFRDGDVQHWWHPPIGRGVRTRITDDLLWLPFALCHYVAVTGDTGILDETRPFLDARPPAENEESVYDQPRVTEETASLYEHGQRAIRHALRCGRHGLPLIGSGDWNDGMNRVGHQGRGESVWLGFFLLRVLRDFGALAARRGDAAFAATCANEARTLAANLDQHAWDGQWYLRGFFDDGTPLGSVESPECRIDSIPQSWAVLAGGTDPQRARTAMQAVLDRLVDRDHRLVRLFDPPFDVAPWDPGYIKGYVPGVRENGGQYTHAAVWVAMAFAALRQGDVAWEIFQYLNPIRHGDTPEHVQTYQLEPYVLAADLYTAPGHEGQGGWSWYTGSAAWLYRLLVEDLLGLRLETDLLSFHPLLPPGWTGFKFTYRYRNTFYHVQLQKTGDETWNTRRVLVDGAEQPDRKIHLVDDGRERHAVIELG
ncbi:MAG: cyclic beta 1-2 glucan synthetase [Kiritimatiellae bacterium]|nr:cyclic beta 1-2 glucan synthetase [Kiritimatiellia bacterium]NLD90738.1 cyclic beta 1-2 glucan synthetase [Lentisphaerota bacterium]